ncbi:MAG: CPBP family intramembrane glutamic endopeptidase [Bacteroidota bacterium]
MKKYFSELFLKTWRESEAGPAATLARDGSLPVEYRIIVILVYTSVGITITKYFGHTTDFLDQVLVNPSKFDWWYCSFFFGTDIGKFHSMLYWVGMIILFYLVFPVMIVKFVFRDWLSDYGIRLKGIQKDYPLYLLMLAIMLPLVYIASANPSFQERYPLFHPAKEPLFPLFFWWQLAYFLQFFAIEFFFRGFMLHGLKYRFGFYSIFVMTIPYCLVHVGKPFAETMAAILAGIILGTLSLKSRSIILGVLIHYSVAISMDLFALWREGWF